MHEPNPPRQSDHDTIIASMPQSGHRGTSLALGAIGLILIGLMAAIFVVLVKDKGSDALGGDEAGADTFSASGSMQVIGTVTKYDDGCYGGDGYDDIQPGAQVVVRDSTGEIVAVDALDSGYVPEKFKGLGIFGEPAACAWGFKVDEIPSGSPAYSVEISHRGEIAFTERTADSIALSLG